jgi:hypothetical protein
LLPEIDHIGRRAWRDSRRIATLVERFDDLVLHPDHRLIAVDPAEVRQLGVPRSRPLESQLTPDRDEGDRQTTPLTAVQNHSDPGPRNAMPSVLTIVTRSPSIFEPNDATIPPPEGPVGQ